MSPASDAMPAPLTLTQASRFWLRLGLVSFGGPAGQIGLLQRELVDRRRWLSERRYLHALNYCMLLPGPEATQLATYLGWLMHGVPGALIAGGLFLAPSVLVLIALATVYALWGQLPLLASVFALLKPAVLAIVIVAAWRVGRRTLHTPLLQALALAAFVALVLMQLPYPLVVAVAALIGASAGRWRPALLQRPAAAVATPTAEAVAPSAERAGAIHDDHTPTPAHARLSRRRLALTLLLWGLALLLPLALLSLLGGWGPDLAVMARFFSKVALLSFGGAYAVLPYVAATRDDLRLSAPLTAITAAVVGVIASLALLFAGPVLWPGGVIHPMAVLLVALALIAQLRLGMSVLQLIAVAAALGLMRFGLLQLLR